MKIEIKHRHTGSVLFSGEYASLKVAVESAVAAKVNLGGANLVGANLVGASLVGASLDGANLGGASLVGANLVGASLVGASLYRANLGGSNLVGASLVGARLDGASLDGSNLYRASLDGASLVGANLVGIIKYSKQHAIFIQLVINNSVKFTTKQQEIVSRICSFRLCWDSIAKEYGKQIRPIFKILADLGWDEYLTYWDEYKKGRKA